MTIVTHKSFSSQEESMPRLNEAGEKVADKIIGLIGNGSFDTKRTACIYTEAGDMFTIYVGFTYSKNRPEENMVMAAKYAVKGMTETDDLFVEVPAKIMFAPRDKSVYLSASMEHLKEDVLILSSKQRTVEAYLCSVGKKTDELIYEINIDKVSVPREETIIERMDGILNGKKAPSNDTELLDRLMEELKK